MGPVRGGWAPYESPISAASHGCRSHHKEVRARLPCQHRGGRKASKATHGEDEDVELRKVWEMEVGGGAL